MSIADYVETSRRELVAELFRRIEEALQPFAADLDVFLAQLFERELPRDWRRQWRSFIEIQATKGFLVDPQSGRELEAWIEAWANENGLLPSGTDTVAPHDNGIGSFVQASYEPTAAGPRVFLAGAPRGRLPRKKGGWTGVPGDSVWVLDRPIKLSTGETITEVTYRQGKPLFDKWSKGNIVIATTGDNAFDRAEALNAWRKQGKEVLNGYVFHHDGLSTETIRFKGKSVVAGMMQLIAETLNEQLPHIGSASLARRISAVSPDNAKQLGKEVNELAVKGKGPIARIHKVTSRGLKQIRKLSRLIPIVGGVLVIINFKQNAEAHGLAGAVIRATPLLGDIVDVYDAAGELADEIRDYGNDLLDSAYEKANEPARNAKHAGAELTEQEFRRLASQLRVTNPYFEPELLKEPLEEFFAEIQQLTFLRLTTGRVQYPDGMTRDQNPNESAHNIRLRQARERLERQIRSLIQEPSTKHIDAT